jgi:hypothetical protein
VGVDVSVDVDNGDNREVVGVEDLGDLFIFAVVGKKLGSNVLNDGGSDPFLLINCHLVYGLVFSLV